MRLQHLLAPLQANATFQRLLAEVRGAVPGAAGPPPFLSVITPARPYALAALHAALEQPLLLLTARPGEARTYAAELLAWVADPDAVYLFPETDALPYDHLPSEPDKLADRLGVLRRLATNESGSTPPLVVASVRAAMDLLLAPDQYRACHQTIRRGERWPPAQLVEAWLRLGYEPSPVVDQPGTFSRRGGILDIFPPGGQPLRFDFWGDEVDTIRAFDPTTQRSTDPLDLAVIGPAHEVLPGEWPVSSLPGPPSLGEEADGPLLPPAGGGWEGGRSPQRGEAGWGALDLSRLRPQFQGAFERDLRFLRDGQAFSTLEFYRGFFGSATLLDYLPPGGVLLIEEPAAVATTARDFEQQVEQLHADLLDRGELPGGIAQPYRSWSALLPRGERAVGVVEIGFAPDRASLPFVHAPKFGGRLERLAETLRSSSGERIVVASQQASRLQEVLAEHGVETTTEAARSSAEILLLNGLLREGWVAPDLGLRLFTDSEIFGWTKQRRAAPSPIQRRAQHAAAARDAFVADLKPGDLVVHEDHGIARYRGLIRTAIGADPLVTSPQRGEAGWGAQHALPGHAEYLLLEYAEGDRLYVPVSQADRVARYVGSGDAQPSLTRLGSGEWTRAKAKVRRSVRDLAFDLMELYAARDAVERDPYPPDSAWQAELEASFPFEETPDQLQAIGAVKSDLERPKPMDRLLVGDVGFGKTEVALRAAFKAVQDGKQVAVLVPTTVLAQQHYNTFCDRLAPFPVRVEMLSRFRSEKEQRQVVKGLADGSVDICIGTHRLVQRDVRFKSLGLAIVDEEQRFGVAHKERLKQLRHEVDVLTLTATPIPRTLHMGLAGVRDMSVLETPPEARRPVRTHVGEYDEAIVREALLRELDRGGQTYFVHNRVQGIETVASRLRKLVPEARIGVAHGQMPEEQLEKTMLQFMEGEFDVLVCTTIIESGLDIPNANTLIVNNADRFGLAQLYQLRGRVGRSTVRAYAYLLFTRDHSLSEVAAERLKTIFEATELGAGFRIAMKDLEIRGAGNLLGAEQSGHIAAVGFDLYTKLLAEQVELLRARKQVATGNGALRLPTDAAPTRFDLPLSAFLPPEYILDDAVRLRLYQRFAAVDGDQALADLVGELEDRFGALPEPTQNLIYLTSLRLRCAEAAVRHVDTVDGEIVVRFDRLPPLHVERLARAAGAPLKAASNQLRLPLTKDTAWMGRLYALVEALPNASGQEPRTGSTGGRALVTVGGP